MRQKILAKLYELKGEHVSGNDLADELGISRVAIWKHIEALKQEGYYITGISGKGYSLSDYNSIILPDEIMAQMDKTSLFNKVLFFPMVDSTNKLGKELLNNNQAEEGLVIVAARQSAGQGRLGRKWDSPLGGLWFSFILKPKLALHELPLLSLVFAVAIASALEEFLDKPCEIKWPNDVFVNGKKMAGILLEVSGQVDNIDYVIAGIGININIDITNLSNETRQVATSLLQETNREIPNSIILPLVLTYLEKYYNLFITEGFGKIRDEFKQKCLHLGRNVAVQQGNKIVTGLNTDIDSQGTMILKVNEDIVRITTGDVKII